jgi:hypothetical protein
VFSPRTCFVFPATDPTSFKFKIFNFYSELNHKKCYDGVQSAAVSPKQSAPDDGGVDRNIISLQIGFYPVAVVLHLRHNTQITHHTQTKHSTQNYTNNKVHTAHNEYNANTITYTTNTIV